MSRREPDDLADALRAPVTVTARNPATEARSTYARVDDEPTLILTYPDAQTMIQGSWNWPDHRKDLEPFGTHGQVFTPDAPSVRMRLWDSKRTGRRFRTDGKVVTAIAFADPNVARL